MEFKVYYIIMQCTNHLIPSQVEEAVTLFKQYVKFPLPALARISPQSTSENVVVYSEHTQRDIDRTEVVKFSRTHVLTATTDGGFSVLFRSPPQEVSKELWNKDSPSGKYRAVIRRVVNKKGEEKDLIEIWDGTRKILNIDTQSLDKHGKIYEPDGQFGTLEWSLSEKQLIYIAEKKIPKSVSYFDAKSASQQLEEDGKSSEPKVKGKQHEIREDWGELLVSKHHPVICLLDLLDGENCEVNTLDSVPDNVSPGQARWGPKDAGILFVGWTHEPWRLGLTYCTMRRSFIYYVDLQSATCETLTADGRAVRSPVFSLDREKLVYLDNPVGGPHFQCSRLMMYDWSSKETSVIVDIVDSVKDNAFPGIYILNLPSRCWTTDNCRLVLDTHWRSQLVSLVVNVEKKTVSKLNSAEESFGAQMTLDVYNDHILAQYSSPNQPHYMVIGNLPPADEEQTVNWMKLDPESHKLEGTSVELLRHEPVDGMINQQYADLDFESVLMKPTKSNSDAKVPLIVCPHGGPHSAFMGDFLLFPAALSACGFAVLLVNYRGSIGFGLDSLQSLLGNIGDQDVKDVQFAAETVIKYDEIDNNRVVITGGSHGGFLTCHLIGQYPDFYRAAVSRNPVTNLVTISSSSDIPDWAFTECGLGHEHSTLADPKTLQLMWEKSPLRYIDQVKTPILIMIGNVDLRVPPKQGHEFYRALKARNIPVRLLSYAENSHPLNKVDAEADSFINMVSWFLEHL